MAKNMTNLIKCKFREMGLRKKLATVSLVIVLLLIYVKLTGSSAEVKINVGDQFQKVSGPHVQAQKSVDTLMDGAHLLHRKILNNGNINVQSEARKPEIEFNRYPEDTIDSYRGKEGTSDTTKSSVSDASKLRQTVMEMKQPNIQATLQPKTETSSVLTPFQGHPPTKPWFYLRRATKIHPPLQIWGNTTRKPLVSSTTRKYVVKQNISGF